MKKYSPALLLIGSLLVFSPVTQADEKQDLNKREQELNQREQELNQREQRMGVVHEKSYGEKVGNKALSGFTNINTALLEIPKSIINTTNDTNIAIGFTGGVAKGILNAVGRLFSGATDLLTAPLPTLPIAQPNYIWQDFDVDTTYGQVFRLDNVPEEISESSAVSEPSTQAVPEENYSNRETTHPELDRRFKEKMMK